MSCEIVLLPMIASSIINSGWFISSFNDYKTNARQAAEKRQAEFANWQQYKKQQQQKIDALQIEQALITQCHEKIKQNVLKPRLQKKHNLQAHATGFLNTERKHQHIELLKVIEETLKRLPAHLKLKQSPLSELLQQLKKLQKLATKFQTDDTIIANFHTMVNNTISKTQQEISQSTKYQQKALDQLSHCLLEILTYQELTNNMTHLEHLENIESQINDALKSVEITPATLQTLQRQSEKISTIIDAEINQSLIQDKLTESIQTSFTEMGYALRQNFTDNGRHKRAVFDIPGGEQVEIALHENNQLACQVQHQRVYDDGSTLSPAEQQHLQTQEARFCSDVQTLIRNLTKTGFEYEIQFERFYPIASVPIVVVEDVSEIIQTTTARSFDDNH